MRNRQRKFKAFKNWKISGTSVFLFRAIELKFMWQISWKILVYFVLDQVKSLKILYLAYQVESLRGKIQSFESFKNSQHFRLMLWAIEPIRGDGNNGKLIIWLNSELSYWSLLFEIVSVNYIFHWKQLL